MIPFFPSFFFLFFSSCTCRFLYEADVVIVMDGGRISHCGRPRKVLPLVEKQLLSIKKTVVEEEVGGAKGGASNKTDNQAQVHVHARVYNIMHRLYTNAINISHAVGYTYTMLCTYIVIL